MTTIQPATAPDQQAMEDAIQRLLQVLDSSAAGLLVAIGHDLGLFDTMADLPPATSEQIADAAGLNERYVREWLGGMTTARFVRYDPQDRVYNLDGAYAPFLVGHSPDNLSPVLRLLPMLGHAVPSVVQRFRTGGGQSYEDYPDFHAITARGTRDVLDSLLLDTVLPLTQTSDRLASGAQVADFGCGSGHAINLLARAFPSSRFVGFDLCEEAVQSAHEEAAAWGLSNATFEVRDASIVNQDAVYDLVLAMDAIHDQADPAGTLTTIRQSLRADGTFLMVDIKADSQLEGNLDLPWATFVYTISTLHCMSVSLGQGGAGLGAAWGVQRATDMLKAAGFSHVAQHDLERDPFRAYFLARP